MLRHEFYKSHNMNSTILGTWILQYWSVLQVFSSIFLVPTDPIHEFIFLVKFKVLSFEMSHVSFGNLDLILWSVAIKIDLAFWVKHLKLSVDCCGVITKYLIPVTAPKNKSSGWTQTPGAPCILWHKKFNHFGIWQK